MADDSNRKSRIAGRTNANHCFRLLQLVFLLETLPPEKRNNATLEKAMQVSRPVFFRVLNDLREVMRMEIPYISHRLKELDSEEKNLHGYYYIRSNGLLNVSEIKRTFVDSEGAEFACAAAATLDFVNEARATYGMKTIG